MGIDPLTFLAQIVNLFVLVWILKRFLYRPVLDIIQKRQNEIDEANKITFSLKEEAEKSVLKIQKQEKASESECQKRQNDQNKELAQLKEKQLDQIKQEVQSLRQKFYEDLKAEKVQAQEKITTFISQDLVHFSEEILKELTNTLPLDRSLELFLEKLNTLNKSECIKINKLLKYQKLIYINSTDTLTQKQQKNITQILKNKFNIPPKCKIIFQKQENLILGIELQISTFSINWSIRAYLDKLEENLNTNLFQNE